MRFPRATRPLTDEGRALRDEAEKITPAVVERLGMPMSEIEHLRAVLGDVIAATAR